HHRRFGDRDAAQSHAGWASHLHSSSRATLRLRTRTAPPPMKGRNTMKKSLAALVVLGLGLGALTGCSDPGSPGDDNEATLTVWYADVMDANPIASAVTQGFYATLQENGIAMKRSLAIDSTTGS